MRMLTSRTPVEDTETTFDELKKEFGEHVTYGPCAHLYIFLLTPARISSGIVAEVTDDKSLPSADRKRLQVEHTPHISREAKIVKMADKIYNLRDLERSRPVGWYASIPIEICQLMHVL